MARGRRKTVKAIIAPIDADAYLDVNRKLCETQRPVDEAAAALRNEKKRAKAKGMDAAAYALHVKLRKMEPTKAIDLIRTALRYAKWEGASYGTQQEMFVDPLDNVRPSEEAQNKQILLTAEEAGRNVGMGGNSATLNPHQAGTELHVAWLKGYTNGKEFHDRSIADGGVPPGERQAATVSGGNPLNPDSE